MDVSRVIDLSYSNIKTRELVKKIAIEYEKCCKKKFAKCKVVDILSYYSYLKEDKKLKDSTIKNRLEFISSLYSKMFSLEIIDKNPYIKAKNSLPKINIQYFPDIKKRIEEVEVDKTIEFVYKKDPYFACALKILKYTGLRIFELASALKDRVFKDKLGNYILPIIGKGDKGRSVFIPSFLMEEIESLENNTEFLLCSKKGRQLDYTHFSHYLLKYSKQAVKKGFSAHKIRSFFATNLLEKGVELNEISKLLGHSSIEITARYYLRTNSNSEDILKHFNKI